MTTAWRFLGIAIRYRAHREWMRAIGGRTTRKILEQYPRIAYRHSTTYLFSDATWAQRLAMITSHYAFLNQTHDADFFEQVIGPNGLLLCHWSLAGHAFEISLTGPCLESRHREGELTLGYVFDGHVLCKLAFSVVPATAFRWASHHAGRSPRMLYIGQVQGVAGQYERVREATRLCHAIAPQDLLMNALAGVADAWGIDALVGVSAPMQLSRGSQSNSPSSFDYTSFWRRYQTVLSSDGHHVVALPWYQRPLTELAAKHRKRTMAKRLFKQECQASVAGAIASYRRDRQLPPSG